MVLRFWINVMKINVLVVVLVYVLMINVKFIFMIEFIVKVYILFLMLG